MKPSCVVCERDAVLRIFVTVYGVGEAVTEYCEDHVYDGYVAALVFTETPRLIVLDPVRALHCPICHQSLNTGHQHE